MQTNCFIKKKILGCCKHQPVKCLLHLIEIKKKKKRGIYYILKRLCALILIKVSSRMERNTNTFTQKPLITLFLLRNKFKSRKR